MNVPGYAKLIAEGQNQEAYRLIRATNPLPAICGRICYAPCQEACNGGQIDEPVAIRELKRFASDYCDLGKLEIPTIEPTGKKVNVAVGAARHDDRLVVFRPDNGSVTRIANDDGRLRIIELGAEATTAIG